MSQVTQNELASPADAETSPRTGKPFAPRWALDLDGFLDELAWQVAHHGRGTADDLDRVARQAMDGLRDAIDAAKVAQRYRWDWSKEQ